jgi:hypothetical protein
MNNLENIPIVLVQLGKLPSHLERNLFYLSRTFPEKNIYLITDSQDTEWISKLNINVVDSNKLIYSWPLDFQVTDRRKYFRNNFWFATKARLRLLPEFMKLYKLEKIIHFESDVWVNPKFPFSFFENLQSALAFPVVDEKRGVASVLYINSKQGIRILERACSDWPELTDMEILGKIMVSEESVHLLPSADGGERLPENGWIFDGAKLGMYLFGSDPRNSRGVLRRFDRSPMGTLQKGEKILLDSNDLVLATLTSKALIANLHIHSKNSNIFGIKWQKVLKKQLLKERLKLNFGFEASAFATSLVELAHAVIRKLSRVT